MSGNDTIEKKVWNYWEDTNCILWHFENYVSKKYEFLIICNGDTMDITTNTRYKSYYENRRVKEILKKDGENDSAYIAFDSSGNIHHYLAPLNFLTHKDSIELSSSYPDWEKKIVEWNSSTK